MADVLRRLVAQRLSSIHMGGDSASPAITHPPAVLVSAQLDLWHGWEDVADQQRLVQASGVILRVSKPAAGTDSAGRQPFIPAGHDPCLRMSI
ncbi:MAG: hypothetical protein VCA57_07685 [Pseudomonas sp.]|uniref:hypothetical protein n=1 Tax=Pseudomonas sp. TaxID=306 RepID=UPI0039821B31